MRGLPVAQILFSGIPIYLLLSAQHCNLVTVLLQSDTVFGEKRVENESNPSCVWNMAVE